MSSGNSVLNQAVEYGTTCIKVQGAAFEKLSGGCPAAQHGLVVKMDPVGFVCGPACDLLLATCQSFLLIHVSKTRKLFKGCHQNFLHLRWGGWVARQNGYHLLRQQQLNVARFCT